MTAPSNPAEVLSAFRTWRETWSARSEERALFDSIEATLVPSPPIGDTGGAGADELLERISDILDEDAPNKWVWKNFESMDEWLRAKVLPALRDARAALVPARVEAVEPRVGPTYDGLRAAIEQSRDRVVAGGGWSLSGKEADTALEWVTFLEGIGAPCPKISGFDEGLQLVWDDGKARHYLALGSTDEDSFVMKLDRSALQANPS